MKQISTKGNAAWLLLSALLAISNGCSGGGGASTIPGPTTTGDFPVNEPLAAALTSKGVPTDIAQYFAAVKLESNCSSSATCTFRQTYPNGATREITVSAVTNTVYTPSVDELASATSVSSPVYNKRYSASGVEDITTQITLSYFVPTTSIPRGPAAEGARRTASIRLAAVAGTTNGFTINWTESGKTGVDVTIGSVLDHYRDTGSSVRAAGTVYAVASAASNVSAAAEVSVQTRAWMAELDALENCAANPTNPLARNDPNYSAAAVAKVRSVRAELKANSAVRFLNVMDETAAGLNSVLSVLSIPLKQAYLWNEQTLSSVTEAAMREARLAVVSCGGSWSGTTSITVSDDAPTYYIKGQLTWVANTQLSTRTVAVYNPEGTLTLEPILDGLTFSPSTHTLSHADGELRIDSSTDPPTYTGTSSTQPWLTTWSFSSTSWTGPAGGAWFTGDGSTSPGGNSISGSKTVGGGTFTYNFTKSP